MNVMIWDQWFRGLMRQKQFDAYEAENFFFPIGDEGDAVEEKTLNCSFFFFIPCWARRGVDRRADMMIIMHVDATGKIALVHTAAEHQEAKKGVDS